MENALGDIRILDLSRVLAGPMGSMLLGDLGADVIRVEAPGGTDDIRNWWPFANGESTYYLCTNRNKRSITINLKTEEGKDLFKQFVAKADVVLENFKTGTLDRLGLGYKILQKVNPSIILCSVTGYGQTGPYRDRPGYDPVIQAVGGLMEVTGHPEGEPTRVGIPIVDIMAAQYVAIGIMGAIRERDRTGKGCHLDISLLDVMVSSLANIASSYLLTGYVAKRVGNEHNNITPYEVFLCKDRPIMIAAGNDGLFKKLAIALGHPEWAEDERLKTNTDRLQNRKLLRELIEKELATKTAGEWTEWLNTVGVPCGPVNNIKDVFEHPQVKEREVTQEVEHPCLGSIPLLKNPIRVNNQSIPIHKHPPILGEHTELVLKQVLGLNDEKIKELREKKVI
ncbi:crotonobetainyl-CoA:carnitine CoA-transferase CaiB-like acyl-CoA transferase [Caldalkalibacillus uzonensis]|uniref:Crotonobetainyl-CoA:carnitine CoA-transferase CaiB-like acyl-CoA transferase n=1 Tax=Caldalkalibacillus uzonensis TaxID=353224 RepID=A0ABU0CXM8_9BACI|nr:CaiB/BaiF CoA-transferase family protein [Caldalkalibacillus uzonensis]MDQ0340830.1 crotonobetainyl-CoA:carnitine CoA-transferase CaiB-like acyl-CoA transferase [Caldalkalibacillus uzonensis]